MSEIGREDVEAALEVRREQGAGLEPALVDAMANRIEATVRRRFEAEVAERRRMELADSSGRGGQIAVAIVSLVLAIPLTGIASTLGLVGMFIAWMGIAAVNIAMAMRRPPKR
ncbi:hypothetical protein [uncultured Tessaracoccus sp.]|uniref:hypothetical protein n=1 Tax=uncultured Tessaracoccus sp. TaxID=905023 RepID=UPI0025F725DF|nr:hypothetical protein [uncultured Tessaracoccus sp.]